MNVGRLILGVLFWTGCVGGLAHLYQRYDGDRTVTGRVWAATFATSPTVRARFPVSAPVAPGNMLRLTSETGLFTIGEVLAVDVVDGGKEARVAVYPEYLERFDSHTRLHSVSTSGRVSWIISTLLPEERLAAIRGVLETSWAMRKSDFVARLQPGLLRLAEDAFTLLGEDFPELLKSRKEEFRVLGQVVRERGWQENLEATFASEVWPMVEARAAPLVRGLGNEILAEVPVWSLSWTFLLQKLPFTDDAALQERFRRFLGEQAVPIVKGHAGEFRDMAKTVMVDALGNEAVVAALQAAAADVAEDPRFRAAIGSVLETWVIDNPRFVELIAGAWQRPDLRGPVEELFSAFDPEIRRIGNMLLLNEQRTGINPDLARILRRKLLREDEDWIYVEFGDGRGAQPPGVLEGLDGGIR